METPSFIAYLNTKTPPRTSWDFVTSGATAESARERAEFALNPEFHGDIVVIPIEQADDTTRNWYGLPATN